MGAMAKWLAASAATAAFVGQASAFSTPTAPTQQASATLLRGAATTNVAATPSAAPYGCVAVVGAVGLAAVATRRQQRVRSSTRVVPVTACGVAKPGDSVPAVSIDDGFPPEKFPLAEYCKGKKVVLVGLPGAFTPT